MPAESKARKCKYCSNAPQQIYRDGHRRGFYKTCGSAKCLSTARSLGAIGRVFQEARRCEHCGGSYNATSAKQRWCKVCVPDSSARARMRRYQMSQPQFEEQKKIQNHLCAICQSEPPTEVDHNHTTGDIRSLLCAGCNVALAFIEDEQWKHKAEQYLREYDHSSTINVPV